MNKSNRDYDVLTFEYCFIFCVASNLMMLL